MKTRYRITPRAAIDLRQISRHTRQKWGKKQRDHYIKKIENRIEWLAEHPLIGKPRPEIRENLSSFPEGEHVIFYKIVDDIIDIIGIIHNHMDAATHLGEH